MKNITMGTGRYSAYVLLAAMMVCCDGGCNDPCDETQSCPDYQLPWYMDADGDGYSDGIKVCSQLPPGADYYLSCQLAGLSVDCNDADPDVYPGASEVCDDGKDNDCDGITDNCSNPPATVWRPAPGTSWQWQLTGTVDTSFDVDMYDIDPFNTDDIPNPSSLIDELHKDGRKVICYFSAGSWEEWRDDADQYPEKAKGDELDGWEDEKWLDIRQLDVLGPLIDARLDRAVSWGCDGVEPDNVDAYSNESGFPLTENDQLRFNRWLAEHAHARGLSVGLKNDLDQVSQLVDDFDWALNEQCFEYEECDMLLPFVQSGKAVFGVEYELDTDEFCDDANEMNFDWLKKNYDLDAERESCR